MSAGASNKLVALRSCPARAFSERKGIDTACVKTGQRVNETERPTSFKTRDEAEIQAIISASRNSAWFVFDARYSVAHHGEFAKTDQRAWVVCDQGDGFYAAFETEIEAIAYIAKDDQIAEVAAAEMAGDSFAAYWAGSVSASVQHHYRRGAFTTVVVA